MNEASGNYQMFGNLVDIILVEDDVEGLFYYYEEYPIRLLNEFEKMTGKHLKRFFLINYEYGKNFSGPGKIRN